MTLDDGFNLLATAPDGIKRLRELILSLAVQGKLVPQDANDQPVSELLKQIRAEKDRLIAEGKIKKDKPLPAISDDEKPFELPEGWEWVRLPDVYFLQEGPGIRNWQFRQDGVKLLNVKNIVKGQLVLDNSDKHISPDEYESKYQHFTIEDGDLLFASSGGSWGKTAIFKDPGYSVIVNTSTIRFQPFLKLVPIAFLRLFIDTATFKSQMERQLVGMQPNFGSTHLSKVLFPLPPLAEQARIVAKVEELMALCDALETRGQLEAEQHARLTATLFDALAASESAQQLQENWARLAASFDLVLDRPQAVDALEQTILQLAVRGLLVPQDPADEPASELLKQIRAEKDRLIAEGKIKKDKPLPVISDEEKPFDLPQGWEWVRFGSVINSSEAGWSPSCDGAPRTGNSWGVLKVSAVSWGGFVPVKIKHCQSSWLLV